MDHGSELKSSKPPHSSSSSSLLGSSTHSLFQLDPKATSFSFDTNGNSSRLGKILNASTSSTSKVLDVSDETMLQNLSAMQSPPVQVMEKSGDFDSNRISSPVLVSDPSTPDSFSFEPWGDRKDTNETHSKLEGILDASMVSASKTLDVTYESEQENMSPTHSPTIQIMEKTGGFDTNEIPLSGFTSKSSTPREWSITSNESLFSIQFENHRFSKDATGEDSYKSGEIDTHELARHRHMPLAPKGGENNKEVPDNAPRVKWIPVEPIKNGVAGQYMVPSGVGANALNHYVGSKTPHKFVDLPITKNSEATGCCAGCTCGYGCCSRPNQCIIHSGCLCARLSCQGCSCKWFGQLSLSCKCIRCCCKQKFCGSCCKWPSLNCCSCKKPKFHRCCCGFPCLNCYCCESITCSCFYFKCPIWKSFNCRCSFCCSWICCWKNSLSSFDTVAKDGGRFTRAAA